MKYQFWSRLLVVVDENNLWNFKVDILCDLCRCYDLGDIVNLVIIFVRALFEILPGCSIFLIFFNDFLTIFYIFLLFFSCFFGFFNDFFIDLVAQLGQVG